MGTNESLIRNFGGDPGYYIQQRLDAMKSSRIIFHQVYRHNNRSATVHFSFENEPSMSYVEVVVSMPQYIPYQQEYLYIKEYIEKKYGKG